MFAHSIGSPAFWAGFLILILAMLLLDLGVFHRKSEAVSVREALIWSVVWISLALAFNAFIYLRNGAQPALEFFTGYIIEKSLSVDNLFVFLVLFRYFSVPAAYQHGILFYGILGALFMRAAFILTGAELLTNFHFMMYLFGLVVIYSGIKLYLHREQEIDPERNPLYRAMKRLIPMARDYSGDRFFIRQNGRLCATAMFSVLLAVELTDVVFAFDSIPAIFAITTDPFIVFTSNIFAILGLRALFFLLAGALGSLYYLNHGLCLILIFIGAKMLLADLYKIPISVSLLVIALVLGLSAAASLIRRRWLPPTPQP